MFVRASAEMLTTDGHSICIYSIAIVTTKQSLSTVPESLVSTSIYTRGSEVARLANT